MKRLTGILVCLLVGLLPLQAMAASLSMSLSQMGYSQNLLIKGPNSLTSFYFPLPKADLQNGTINLYLEPSPYLNNGSTFAILLNDEAVAGVTAGQLKQNSLVRLTLPPGAAMNRGVTVTIRTGLFTTDDLCVDWRKGYLYYSVLNKSNLQLTLTPPVPQTIPDFFAGLYQGLAIVLPQNPTKNEISAGVWLYGALQKNYPFQSFQLILGTPQGMPANMPQIWLAERDRLPQNIKTTQDNLCLTQPDKLVVTATNGSDLTDTAKQLMELPSFSALQVSRSSVNVSGQHVGMFQDKIEFGNVTAQDGISVVAMDFPLYPSMLSTLPKSLGIHLEGRYSPSPLTGRPVRLDVLVNRNLIYSEALDNSGILNHDINLPDNIRLKAKNQLSIEFSYPEGINDCDIRGPLETAQILSSSYFVGLRSINRDQLTWDSVGMLFSRSGILFIPDSPTNDDIKAAAQAMAFLNSQLPPGQVATPQIRLMSQYKEAIAADYIVVLAGNGGIPEEMAKGLPLQMGQNTTIYQTNGQTSEFSYQSSSAGVLGQIGQYKGIPLIAFHSMQSTQKFSSAIYALTKSYDTAAPMGNIYVYRDSPSFLSTLPLNAPEQYGPARFFSLPWNLYEQVYRLGGEYYRFLFLALLVLIVILFFRVLMKRRR